MIVSPEISRIDFYNNDKKRLPDFMVELISILLLSYLFCQINNIQLSIVEDYIDIKMVFIQVSPRRISNNYVSI